MLMCYTDGMNVFFDSLLNDLGITARTPEKTRHTTRYSTEIVEGVLHLHVDVPGVLLSDVDVSVDKNVVAVVTLRNKRKSTHRFTISDEFVTKPSSATLSRGVLELKFQPRTRSNEEKIEITEVK